MANIGGWGGPLPQSFIDAKLKLQKKILARQREFGITPILPAFAGHVPPQLKKVYPNAKIAQLTPWTGFDQKYYTYFLDPMDPLFYKIQQLYLQTQTAEYGTNHIYSADPFNEMVPPSWEPEYLATVSETIYSSMKEVDPDASWVQMGWLFFHSRNHWTNDRIKAALQAVPQDKMILLDYYGEYIELWRQTEAFFGQPWIWCYLGNFGGKTDITGHLEKIEEQLNAVLKSSEHKQFWGIGTTLEGFDVNPVVYEFLFEKAWHPEPVDMKHWCRDYARRRMGMNDPVIEAAWDIMRDKIYRQTCWIEMSSIIRSRPCLSGRQRWSKLGTGGYDEKDLEKIWTLLIKADTKVMLRDSYRYDLVNITRQVLSNYALRLRNQMNIAYENRDEKLFQVYATEFLQLLCDLDRLLTTRGEFLLGKWLEDAKSFAISEKEEKYYEFNARNLLTTWGHPNNTELIDYSARDCGGLIKGYYLPRWQLLINMVSDALEKGQSFDGDAFEKQVGAFEWKWIASSEVYPSFPIGDSVTVVMELYKKYLPRLDIEFPL